jgi:hypothetical protein
LTQCTDEEDKPIPRAQTVPLPPAASTARPPHTNNSVCGAIGYVPMARGPPSK